MGQICANIILNHEIVFEFVLSLLNAGDWMISSRDTFSYFQLRHKVLRWEIV